MGTAAPGGLARGTAIDRYIVLDQLGAGAMGVVYQAYDPELDRKVALKLLQPDDRAPSEQRRGRIKREAQATARLAHANVVAVYDVGEHAGDVFIAFELLDGCTLRDWLGQGRSWREVLAVYLQAGQGLWAAHQAGIVHRDFKPENVIVTRDGRVKVCDFGLAAAVEGPSSEETQAPADASATGLSLQMTKTGAWLGTPNYMPPEQMGGRSDARADQFSFCVALYEALYGFRPFQGDTFYALMMDVMHGEPRPVPSGSGVPRRVQQALLRGLRADREERFPELALLLDELGGALPTRQSRRLTWMAFSMAATCLAMAPLAWNAAVRQRACSGAAREVGAVWSVARREAVRQAFRRTALPYAETALASVERAVDGYLGQWAVMHREACEATQVRHEQSAELMDLRMSCLSERLTELDTLLDVYSRADGKMVERATDAVESLPTVKGCADAVALRTPVAPPGDPAVRRQIDALGAQIARASALNLAGRFEQSANLAEPAAKRAAELGYRPLEGKAHLTLARARAALGAWQPTHAEYLLALTGALAGHDDATSVNAAIGLIHVAATNLNHFDEAEQWLAVAAALIERVGRRHELSGELLLERSSLRHQQGRLAEALADAREGAGVLIRALPPGHLLVSKAHLFLGNRLYESGQYAQALVQFEAALALEIRTLGADHPSLATELTALANVHGDMGQHERAIDQYRRAIALLERSSPGSAEIAEQYANLGTELFHTDVRGAIAAYERAYAIQSKAEPTTNAAITMLNLGEGYAAVGRLDDALQLFRRSLATTEKLAGPSHPLSAGAHWDIGDVYRVQGRLAEAVREVRRGLELGEKSLGPTHPQLTVPLLSLGRIYLALHQPTPAVRSLERALAIHRQQPGDRKERADIESELARALLATGQKERVEALSADARLDAAGSGERSLSAPAAAGSIAHPR